MDRRQVVEADMRKNDVLLVADPRLARAVALGEIGDQVHLVGGGVAGRAADRLQGDRDEAITADAVGVDVLLGPVFETGIELTRPLEDDALRRARLNRLRHREIALDAADLLLQARQGRVPDALPFLIHLARICSARSRGRGS
jgi:hypothetical protein